MFPEQRTIRRLHAIEITIVAGKEDPPIPSNRWQAHGPFGEERPCFMPIANVIATTLSRSLNPINIRPSS